MKYLAHNGVLVPKYEVKGFRIWYKGKQLTLTPLQEEMAVAWVKKLETSYVKDKLFVNNFFTDFGKVLNIEGKVALEDFDFSEIQRYIEEEKVRRLNIRRDEKKKRAEDRKMIREANKARYGYAVLDGEKIELASYMVEPSCIFMGRGKHPLRGRWKQGAMEEDITLNLSPDAPKPKGKWKEVVWQKDSMWVAKWDDKLRGKEKYIWLAEHSTLKQERDREKFDKAEELGNIMEKLRSHIASSLTSLEEKRRKVATVCYLIDALKLRVGDEKDKDETDTVGATTLRPEHIKIQAGGVVSFDFLGKDAVRWKKEIKLPEAVIHNLKEFMSNTKSSIFNGVRSDFVSQFLNEVMPGLTAKVFRTYHASKVVKDYLANVKVENVEPEYVKKKAATLANLQAAVVCNHKRKLPKNWHKSLKKQKLRLNTLKAKKLDMQSRGKNTETIDQRIVALTSKIQTAHATRDYNLRTSLKSYIDPRIYRKWGQHVDYDWKLYYPKTLQNKFSWIEKGNRRYTAASTGSR